MRYFMEEKNELTKRQRKIYELKKNEFYAKSGELESSIFKALDFAKTVVVDDDVFMGEIS